MRVNRRNADIFTSRCYVSRLLDICQNFDTYKEELRGKRRDTGVWVDKLHQLSCLRAMMVSASGFLARYTTMTISRFFHVLFFAGENWTGVQLDEFMRCDSNLATNRQTRMLSDLALVGCYNKTAMPAHERDRIMLASAKRNLATMSYFGLTEYQKVSCRVLVIVLYDA